jgi:hypothetical protein
VHASATPFRMSSTLRKPDATAFSAHRRAADQNAVLCAAQQKRFGEPPRRAGNARLHQGHTSELIMRNSPASRRQRTCSSPLARQARSGHALTTKSLPDAARRAIASTSFPNSQSDVLAKLTAAVGTIAPFCGVEARVAASLVPSVTSWELYPSSNGDR